CSRPRWSATRARAERSVGSVDRVVREHVRDDRSQGSDIDFCPRHMAGRVKLGHLYVGPGESMAGLGEQLSEELPLSAPIVLPERMSEVQVVVEVGDLVDERDARQATQQVAFSDPASDVRDRTLDVQRRDERALLAIALRDADGP